MKTKYLLYLLTGFIYLSCSEDKGNYDYHPVDELGISGISANDLLTAGDSLNIQVTFSHTVETPESNFSYIWEIDGRQVATSRDLHILCPSDISFGEKLCRYTVKDETNGMKYFKTFKRNIVSPFNYGYYFLTEKDDHSTVLSYFSIKQDNDKYIHTTSVNGIALGDKPAQILGFFGYIEGLNYCWTINITTQEGEYPLFRTENVTFIPNRLINSSCFFDQGAGYVFSPEAIIIDMRDKEFFISQGKFISYNNGLLYRPAKHDKEYYWSHPIRSERGRIYMFVFDKLSKKYFIIQPYANDPVHGIVGDQFAYDQVVEVKDFQPIEEQNIITTAMNKGNSYEYATIVTASPEGFKFIEFYYDLYGSGEAGMMPGITLPAAGVNENSQTITYEKNWYFSIGNKIYTSPRLLPKLMDFIDVPSEYGKIIKLEKSANESQLVIITYDEQADAEYKGSVIFIDLATKKMTPYKHIIHKCVSMLGANSDPWGFGYGDGK